MKIADERWVLVLLAAAARRAAVAAGKERPAANMVLWLVVSSLLLHQREKHFTHLRRQEKGLGTSVFRCFRYPHFLSTRRCRFSLVGNRCSWAVHAREEAEGSRDKGIWPVCIEHSRSRAEASLL